MGLRDVTDPGAVTAAMREFDQLGREAFLARYGFGPSRRFVIEQGGQEYDSKAIVGAAHGYQHGVPLAAHEFSGGDATVQPLLSRLGFRVIALDMTDTVRPAAQPDATEAPPLRIPRSDPEPGWKYELGDVTTRSEISAQYGGSIYGGIESSRRTPNVFVYTDPSQGALNGYNYDGWDPNEPGVFYYTGEGRNGDQRMAVGNKAILDHAENGKTIRLFEALDQTKRPGGKRQRYVGAFRLDESRPWRTEPAPGADKQQRKVIVFRLVNVDREHRGADTPPELPSGTVTFVPSENNQVSDYEMTPASGAEAKRREGQLVREFEDHLRGLSHDVCRARIAIPGEQTRLVTDPYDRTTHTLYEAKSSTDRGTIRLAVGQLLDYLRYLPDATGAILVPNRPEEDLIRFVHSLGFSIHFQAASEWISLPAASPDG